MTPVKVFLILVFAAALTVCVMASLFGSGTTGTLLYNLGAVVALVTAVTAMSDRILHYLLNGEDQ